MGISKRVNLTLLTDFLNLIYPGFCHVCHSNLIGNERIICTACLYDLPKTNFWLEKDNPVEQLFWGKVEIERAVSFYYYRKGSAYQKLMHQFKYKNRRMIGYELGMMFGNLLKKQKEFGTMDYILPVPLHKAKLRKRGFNQSEVIASGMGSVMGLQVMSSNVYRKKDTGSQTLKNRYERWQNVEHVFSVRYPGKLKDKHILLVDDVVTTGSTLEALALKIKEIENTRISIATLAYADFS